MCAFNVHLHVTKVHLPGLKCVLMTRAAVVMCLFNASFPVAQKSSSSNDESADGITNKVHTVIYA